MMPAVSRTEERIWTPLAALAGGRSGMSFKVLDLQHLVSAVSPLPLVALRWPPQVLQRLATGIGTLAIITGRPAPVAVELGGFAGIPGLIVIGHHGFDRWDSWETTADGEWVDTDLIATT